MLSSVADMDVLIIEDAKPLALLLTEYLKKLGYRKIHCCKSGNSGIRKFQELVESNIVPIVFLDYYLPDLDAPVVLKKILKIHPGTEVVVETVANQNESGIKRLFELGAHEYFPKPYEPKKLETIMDTLQADADPELITTN